MRQNSVRHNRGYQSKSGIRMVGVVIIGLKKGYVVKYQSNLLSSDKFLLFEHGRAQYH